MGLSTPGQAEIVSLDSNNIDDVLSKTSRFILHICPKANIYIKGKNILENDDNILKSTQVQTVSSHLSVDNKVNKYISLFIKLVAKEDLDCWFCILNLCFVFCVILLSTRFVVSHSHVFPKISRCVCYNTQMTWK